MASVWHRSGNHLLRLLLVAMFAVASAAAVALGAVPAGAGSLPAPTLIASAVSSGVTAPCAPPACAVPDVLVQQGAPFSVQVTLSAGGAPAAFNKDTPLTLTAPGPGVLSPSTVTMPGGASTFTFTGISYSTFTNGVTVTASGGKKSTAASTPSNTFDVLQTLKTDAASPHVSFQDGAGPTRCATATAADPVCGVVVLPNGSNSDVLLSSGSCAGIGCNVKGTVTQVIADLTSQPLYSNSSPATLIIKCYRTVCGQGGVNKYTAAASLSASGALTTVPACPAKGTLGTTQDFCTDYVQSTRSNSDQLLLFVLFDRDFRGSIS
jgi:hypothetical protein